MRTQVMNQFSEGEKAINSIAMLMVLVSFAMLFTTLFLGYVLYRTSSPTWPPLGMARVDLFLPTVSTIIIALSSFSFVGYQQAYDEGKVGRTRFFWGLTFLLGASFMVSQLMLWSHLKLSGVYVDTTIFASVIYAFTWVHAGHIVGGLMALLFLIPSFLNTKKNYALRVTNIGKFWHFLGVVWFVMYVGLFVL
jgi:cytochrome c oxidase subunit III